MAGVVLVLVIIVGWGIGRYYQRGNAIGNLGSSSKLARLTISTPHDSFSPFMSSIFGFELLLDAPAAATFAYTCTQGSFCRYENGQIENIGDKITTEETIYWCPSEKDRHDEHLTTAAEILLSVAALDERGQVVAQGMVVIEHDLETGFFVFGGNPSSGKINPAQLEKLVGLAVLAQNASYLRGETATEGHLILDTVEDEQEFLVYAIASHGNFAFENGVFTKVSGSGAIPTVLLFSRDEGGGYALIHYQNPEDGSRYLDSVKEMFPRRLHRRVLAAHNDYPVLLAQEEAQATAYLASIGREALVNGAHVEKELAQIDVDASNKLFSEFTKEDLFLNDCPNWLGTREKLEDGVRYIFETAQEKTADGYDLIIFQKKTEDGHVIEEQSYKIVGSEPLRL